MTGLIHCSHRIQLGMDANGTKPPEVASPTVTNADPPRKARSCDMEIIEVNRMTAFPTKPLMLKNESIVKKDSIEDHAGFKRNHRDGDRGLDKSTNDQNSCLEQELADSIHPRFIEAQCILSSEYFLVEKEGSDLSKG